ncbi:mucin-6-like [Saccoglossus kowalevskii]
MGRFIVSSLVIFAIVCQSTAKVVKRAEGNPHDLMVPGQGQASKCLQCKLSDKMSLAECLMKPETDTDKYEICQTSRVNFYQIGQRNTGLVFISECEQIEACIEESENEPNFNECDVAPIYVKTKCRYCCNNNTITQGYYCPPPRAVVNCTVWGDPRFNTFDGYRYHEGGDCDEYTLLHMNCSLHDLKVKITELKTRDHYRVETLILEQHNERLVLGVNNGVDPVTFTLFPEDGPPIDEDDFPGWHGDYNQFLLSKHGDSYHVTMDVDSDGFYDLVVKWEIRRVELELSQPYSECYNVRGLCGDSNGSPEYELITPANTNATDETEFHRSWGQGCPL